MYYMAYGSNMNIKQMKQRCPHSKLIGKTILKDWRLIFNIHLDIVEEKGQETPVVIWNIPREDWKNLDRYEGYPSYYIKKILPVKLKNKTIKAVVYVMNDGCKGICPPTDLYFDTCQQGYIDNFIELDYLYDALHYSYMHETKYNQYNRRDGLFNKNKKIGKYKKVEKWGGRN